MKQRYFPLLTAFAALLLLLAPATLMVRIASRSSNTDREIDEQIRLTRRDVPRTSQREKATSVARSAVAAPASRADSDQIAKSTSTALSRSVIINSGQPETGVLNSVLESELSKPVAASFRDVTDVNHANSDDRTTAASQANSSDLSPGLDLSAVLSSLPSPSSNPPAPLGSFITGSAAPPSTPPVSSRKHGNSIGETDIHAGSHPPEVASRPSATNSTGNVASDFAVPVNASATDTFYDSTGHLAMVAPGESLIDQPGSRSEFAAPERRGNPLFGSSSPRTALIHSAPGDSAIEDATALADLSPAHSGQGTDKPGTHSRESIHIPEDLADEDERATGRKSRPSRTSTDRKTNDRKKTDRNTSAETTATVGSNPAAMDDVPLPKRGQDNAGAANVEDVVLQTPVESQVVGRVEDVLATTRARGWPIALVRSDLPGDDWWVQQMVGIHGTTFAARVNFGNENSISGSAYRLIFVFLDSPEEVRRFRIAKQFKDLPEGTRRSREFRFVRK